MISSLFLVNLVFFVDENIFKTFPSNFALTWRRSDEMIFAIFRFELSTMNSFERTLKSLKGEPSDRLCVQPLFMIYAADMIDIDYLQTIAEARAGIPDDICLSGNLDPVSQLKNSNPSLIKEDFARCYKEAGNAYIVAPGCEVPPATPGENIRAMSDFAKGH